jgi:hypothetical protein
VNDAGVALACPLHRPSEFRLCVSNRTIQRNAAANRHSTASSNSLLSKKINFSFQLNDLAMSCSVEQRRQSTLNGCRWRIAHFWLFRSSLFRELLLLSPGPSAALQFRFWRMWKHKRITSLLLALVLSVVVLSPSSGSSTQSGGRIIPSLSCRLSTETHSPTSKAALVELDTSNLQDLSVPHTELRLHHHETDDSSTGIFDGVTCDGESWCGEEREGHGFMHLVL